MPARILIVDDHEIMREGLKRLLEAQSDFEVVGTRVDTDGACQAAVDLQPDVIVMDLDIPGEGGVFATECIRATQPEIKVVVLTGHAEAHHVQAALVAGAHAYLLKTQASADLVTGIRAVLAGDTYLCSKISTVVVHALQESAGAKRDNRALSPRETQVLTRLADGQSTKEIAFVLALSAKTVESHRINLMTKLGVTNVATLTKYALREGLTTL